LRVAVLLHVELGAMDMSVHLCKPVEQATAISPARQNIHSTTWTGDARHAVQISVTSVAIQNLCSTGNVTADYRCRRMKSNRVLSRMRNPPTT
jgi:hypothetical protein